MCLNKEFRALSHMACTQQDGKSIIACCGAVRSGTPEKYILVRTKRIHFLQIHFFGGDRKKEVGKNIFNLNVCFSSSSLQRDCMELSGGELWENHLFEINP